MRQDDRVILEKMIGYCDDVAALLEEYDFSFDEYQNRISFQYSCNMCIIQIGELVSRLSDDFQEDHPGIPWRAIKAMRNLHAHDYEKVNFEIVWNTLREEIPGLRKQLSDILSR